MALAATIPTAATMTHAIVDRAGFAAALTVACRTTSKRASIPLLSAVLLRANPAGGLFVQATDLDQFASIPVTGAVDPDFRVAIPAHTLRDIVKRAKATDEVAIDCGQDSVVLDFGGLRITTKPIPDYADFPEVPFAEHATVHAFTLPTVGLATLLEKVSMAVSTEETRYYLNGVYFHPLLSADKPNVLRAVATDGHRAARYELPLPIGAGEMMGSILPLAAVTELAKLIGGKGAPATVGVRVSIGVMEFTVGGTVLRTKLIDGSFPDYVKVMPKATGSFVATVSKGDLVGAIREVTTIRSDRGRAIGLAFGHEGTLVIRCNNPDIGEATTRLACDFTGGQDFDVGCNSDYLNDVLAVMGETVVLEFGRDLSHSKDAVTGEITTTETPLNSGPFRITDPEDPAYLYVQMPMRV